MWCIYAGVMAFSIGVVMGLVTFMQGVSTPEYPGQPLPWWVAVSETVGFIGIPLGIVLLIGGGIWSLASS